MMHLNNLMKMFFYQEPFYWMSTWKDRTLRKKKVKKKRKKHVCLNFHFQCFTVLITEHLYKYLRTVCVVKHTEYNMRHWVLVAVMMRWRQNCGQVVLQCLTQNAIKRQVGTRYVLFCPIILPQFPNLSPKTVQVLERKSI